MKTSLASPNIADKKAQRTSLPRLSRTMLTHVSAASLSGLEVGFQEQFVENQIHLSYTIYALKHVHGIDCKMICLLLIQLYIYVYLHLQAESCHHIIAASMLYDPICSYCRISWNLTGAASWDGRFPNPETSTAPARLLCPSPKGLSSNHPFSVPNC